MNLDDMDAVEQAALDPAFLEYVLDRHRRTVHTLIAGAAVEWIAAGCPRYNDRETSCSAGLIGHLVRKIDAGKAQALQPRVILEVGAWTQEHLNGEADPSRVPRPDVVMWLGLQGEARMNIECKRLLSGSASPRQYVEDGMCRFLNGRYPVDQGVGTMVGFLLDRTPLTAADQISAAILVAVGRDEPLQEDTPLETLDSIYRSLHASDGEGAVVELVHLLLDIRSRAEARHG